MSLSWETLAQTPDGEAVKAVTLDNGLGLRARVLNYGATLLALQVPDRLGRPVDVVLGFDDVIAYFSPHPYFGAIIGRYANRIAGARFVLGGTEYRLAANDGKQHLHGGRRGFDKVVWHAVAEETGAEPRVTWHYASRAGEEGYPGNLDVHVSYGLTANNALRLDYTARSDALTILNLTHHAYWNLAGHGDILDHQLQILGSHFLPVASDLIPTGEQRPVRGTPMDFLGATPIRSRLDPDAPQLRHANGGFDHTWVLDRGLGRTTLAARLYDPRSGIAMEVWTTEPGLQFYSGNFLDGTLVGKLGQAYPKHAGLCLEAQHFPDSPHRPGFPSTALEAGDTYQQTTLYRFSLPSSTALQ
jgi:aldose 1-epimerase